MNQSTDGSCGRRTFDRKSKGRIHEPSEEGNAAKEPVASNGGLATVERGTGTFRQKRMGHTIVLLQAQERGPRMVKRTRFPRRGGTTPHQIPEDTLTPRIRRPPGGNSCDGRNAPVKSKGS